MGTLQHLLREGAKNRILLIQNELRQSIDFRSRFTGEISQPMTDCFAKALVPEDLPQEWEHAIPVKTKGDGNCLYNAASFCLVGDSRIASNLRKLTAIELYLNVSLYTDHPRFAMFDELEKITAFSAALSDEACT